MPLGKDSNLMQYKSYYRKDQIERIKRIAKDRKTQESVICREAMDTYLGRAEENKKD